jgi:hypothetical protein
VFEPKRVKWEYNIRFGPAENWRINGIIPPDPWGSDAAPEAYREWLEADEPVPYGEYVEPH